MDPENGRMVALISGSAGVLNRTTSFRRIILPALGKALRTACVSPLVTLEGLAINGPPIIEPQMPEPATGAKPASYDNRILLHLPAAVNPRIGYRLVTKSPARSGGGALAGGPPRYSVA